MCYSQILKISDFPLQTQFQFFDITPLGRLLNRFSSDTYTVDDSLPFILNIFLAQLVGLIGTLIVFINFETEEKEKFLQTFQEQSASAFMQCHGWAY